MLYAAHNLQYTPVYTMHNLFRHRIGGTPKSLPRKGLFSRKRNLTATGPSVENA